jgi:hypothetical protein
VSELNAPVSRSLRLLFGGTAASVGLAIALGLVIAREIAQRRRMEALQSAAALLDAEKRGALAIDAAELGTWRWDLSANEFRGCGRLNAASPTRATRPLDQLILTFHRREVSSRKIFRHGMWFLTENMRWGEVPPKHRQEGTYR